jgi:hypothetical protein
VKVLELDIAEVAERGMAAGVVQGQVHSACEEGLAARPGVTRRRPALQLHHLPLRVATFQRVRSR